MPFKTFAVNEILTSSDTNTYLMQGVHTVTSASRPAHSTGRVIFETDTGKIYISDGTTWVEMGDIGAYDTYTPSWTATTTNPTIGNGTLTGRYRRIGKKVTGYLNMTAGTTTTFGSGNYRFTLPSNARRTPDQSFMGHVLDSSASAFYLAHGLATLSPGNILTMRSYAGGAGGVLTAMSETSPVTFATSDQIYVTFEYEEA